MPEARFCGNCGHSIPGSVDQDQAPTIMARPPPAHAPPGAGSSPRPGAHARTSRQSVFLWPAVVVLAVLLAGGGFSASLVLIRHFDGDRVPENLTADSPPTASPASSSMPPTSTQVSMQGAAVGISAVKADPDATAIAATLATYFGGINTKKYTQAWDAYTAALQAAIGFQSFATAVSTTQDSQIVVQSIQHDASGNIEAHVSFQSHQAGQYGPRNGETCTNWSLDYHLVPAGMAAGPASLSYLIDKVTDIGSGHTSC
jgi:hypothetical protein